MKDLVSYLYKNTELKISEDTDKFLKSRVNLALEELRSVSGERDEALDIKCVTAMLKLCKAIRLDYKGLYLYNRKVTSREVVYTLADMETGSRFDILTEIEGNTVHTGILIDFDTEEGER